MLIYCQDAHLLTLYLLFINCAYKLEINITNSNLYKDNAVEIQISSISPIN